VTDRTDSVVLVVLAAIGAALIAALVADCAKGTGDAHAVEIVDRWYSPASTTTDVGMTGGPRPQPVVTTHHVPERWGVVVRDGDVVRSIATGVAEWSCAKPGAIWTLRFRVGHWTGIHYDEQLVVGSPLPEATP
jgi:hypothetical protein